MSRWLQNVGSFLEKLDDQAERVAVVEDDDEGLQGVPEDVQLQSILTARGLSQNENDEDNEKETEQQRQSTASPEERDNKEALDAFPEDDFFKETSVEMKQPQQEETNVEATTAEEEKQQSPSSDTKTEEESSTVLVEPSSQEMVDEKPATQASSLPEFLPKSAPTSSSTEEATESKESSGNAPNQEEQPTQAATTTSQQPSEVLKTPAKIPAPPPATTNDDTQTAANAQPQTPSNTHFAALRETQKEARTLRRHVVSLNKQLEHAETELQAQRVELERAAERLEKDRVRHKEDREKEKTRHEHELKTLKAQSEKTLKELKQRSDTQVEDVRKQLRTVEERRMQEGGDWNKELKDAVLREQEMAAQYADLQDEKATLLSQIAILQDQQEALGNRIESLSQTADNAMERERESESRLDEALNLHARQLAQRQARESELERTVSELGSALVAARASSGGGSSRHLRPEQDNDNTTETAEARVQSLEQDMDGLVAQLQFEKERCETLQNELRDVSKERTDEATANHARDVKHDRQVAELSHTIARLEAELRAGNGDKTTTVVDPHDRQMRELSEEVLRQREKLAHSHSEISALKSRLHVANERVQTAEAALEAAGSQDDDGDTASADWRDVERAPVSGNGSMRRRGKRSHRPLPHKGESMRAALHLGGGQSSEQIGRALDGVDAFLVSSGRFLRHNALARLLFIAYLVLLHLWTFVLIVLHAHGFETVHGDFGAGGAIGHGPHMLMQGSGGVAADKLPSQPVAVAAAAVDKAANGG